MKFLRILLLPLLSILVVSGNQSLENLYSYPLGANSVVKNNAKTDGSAREGGKMGASKQLGPEEIQQVDQFFINRRVGLLK